MTALSRPEPQRHRACAPPVARPSAVAGVAALVAVLAGCNRVPPGRTAVDDVTVRGAHQVDADDVADRIATTKSPRFLGLFPGVVYEYSVFDRNVLQRDLARVEAFYRSKGYYGARARAGRVHVVDDQHVRVEIVVEEGEPIQIRGVRVDGLADVPKDIALFVEGAARAALVEGKPFDEEAFDKAAGAVRRALTDRGYAYAKVTNDAAVDLVRREADVVLTVSPGEPCVFGPVTIEGLGDLPEKPVRRALDIEPNTPFSEAALDNAQQAVLDFGVFASVDVAADLPEPPRADRVVPVKVKLEPSRLRTVRLGGGVEFDALKTDVHGVFGWEHRNFLGGLRTFSVNLKPGVVLYPLRVTNLELPNRLLPEERLRLEFRQPGFVEARTNAFIRPEFNVQALLLDPNPPPNAKVIGYAEARNGIGVDRSYWRFFGALSHNLQVAYPFAYVGERDPTLGTLVISYPELVTTLDLRDDRVHPRKGLYLLNTLQVAGGPFGGQADDVKVQPDLRAYVPIRRGVVLAMRGSVGLLFARNYGGVVRTRDTSVFEPSEARTRDYQLTFFRGFFSGGPTSNRGYPLRGVGPHDIVPFISPAIEVQRLGVSCGEGFDCRSPTGGFTLWEASAEIRFEVTGPLSAATFCDASDVSPRTANIRLTHLHLSCGAGARYDTPVGPVRLDVGYRIPGMQVIGGLTSDERAPQTFPLGIPIAVSLGIGEAY
ncbi:MAG: BamA/TamA family outer membrane protein [Labilithrix sp.]|nr:BamA/TamA family outer membrane protein [Labilithrix sp.]